MTEFERFAAALAKTESNDFELTWGDAKEPDGTSQLHWGGLGHSAKGANFMAMGRWQMHPAWYHDWHEEDTAVDASWDEEFRRALERFWHNHLGGERSIVHMAMVFHL